MSQTPTLAPAEAMLAGTLPRWARVTLLAIAGTLLLTLSAKIKVPFWPVEMTMQPLAVLLIGMTFGRALAVATVALYLAQGALGLPVFTGTPEKGLGLAYMAGPTGGYLAGFLLAALVTGWLADRGAARTLVPAIGVAALGIACIYGPGLAWLATIVGVEKALAFGLYPFVLGDALKALIAAIAVSTGWRLAR